MKTSFSRWAGIFSAFVIFGLILSFANDAAARDRKRIVLLKTMPVPVVNKHCDWFVKHMDRIGYRQGDTIDLQIFEANGDRNRAERFLRLLLKRQKPDLVVTSATLASQAANKVLKGSDIPFLFFTVTDPFGAGIVRHVGEPTRENITGIVHTIDRSARIDIVRKLVEGLPGKRPFRIGLIHSTYQSAMGDLRETRNIEKKLDDIHFFSFQVEYRKVPEGLPGMLRDAKKLIKQHSREIDFWWQLSGPLGEVSEFTELILSESKNPIVLGQTRKSVELGALLHLTPSIEGTGQQAALLADSILKGTHPGTLPVIPPPKIDLGINLTTAIKMGIVIPPDIIGLAGDNIYR